MKTVHPDTRNTVNKPAAGGYDRAWMVIGLLLIVLGRSLFEGAIEIVAQAFGLLLIVFGAWRTGPRQEEPGPVTLGGILPRLTAHPVRRLSQHRSTPRRHRRGVDC